MQAGPGCERGQGLLRQRALLSALAGQNHAGQRELSPSSGAGARPAADVRPPLALAGASTCPGCRRRAALEPFVALLYLQTGQFLLYPGRIPAQPGIFGQLHHYYLFFLIITIIITY